MNIKKDKPTRHHFKDYHTSYGLQKFLHGRGVCIKEGCVYQMDDQEYQSILGDFVLSEKPDFDFSKLKNGLISLERFTQKRFGKFCRFIEKNYVV